MEIKDGFGKAYIKNFNSLDEFYKYITTTEVNDVFRTGIKFSQRIEQDGGWSGTKTFEDACDLFINGWDKKTLELKQKLDAEEHKEPQMTYKNIQSVQGYHPIVPLYLMGVPNNMVTKKMIPLKRKVITIDKTIAYAYSISAEQIMEEAVKAVRIINRLERQNYRVNLNLVGVSERNGVGIGFKIKLKSANESLNISKLTFPLIHPSMLRRLFLRFVEVNPHTVRGFTSGYGRPLSGSDVKRIFVKDGTYKDDYVLPDFINADIDKINDIKDLEKL